MDQGLLEAIGQMMDSKLEKALNPINERLDKIDQRLASYHIVSDNSIDFELITLKSQ